MWSLQILIGIPVFIIFIVGAVICAYMLNQKMKNMKDASSYEKSPYKAGIIALLALAVILLGTGLVSYWPYGVEYHRWQTVKGEVSQVGDRILGSSSSLQQKFVVVINGQEYGCEDTRCAVVLPGDTLELSCLRKWQYAGVPGYDCEFRSRIPHK